jgi:ribose/xylose/arabinose/galactoside ABC-type transport system permease subunit
MPSRSGRSEGARIPAIRLNLDAIAAWWVAGGEEFRGGTGAFFVGGTGAFFVGVLVPLDTE